MVGQLNYGWYVGMLNIVMHEVPILVLIPAIIGIIVAVVFGIRIVRIYSNVEVVLKKWSQDNACVILHGEMRWLRRGPFLFSNEGQAVYRVKVQRENGTVHMVWVRCSGYFHNEWSGGVEAKWD